MTRQHDPIIRILHTLNTSESLTHAEISNTTNILNQPKDAEEADNAINKEDDAEVKSSTLGSKLQMICVDLKNIVQRQSEVPNQNCLTLDILLNVLQVKNKSTDFLLPKI